MPSSLQRIQKNLHVRTNIITRHQPPKHFPGRTLFPIHLSGDEVKASYAAINRKPIKGNSLLSKCHTQKKDNHSRTLNSSYLEGWIEDDSSKIIRSPVWVYHFWHEFLKYYAEVEVLCQLSVRRSYNGPMCFYQGMIPVRAFKLSLTADITLSAVNLR